MTRDSIRARINGKDEVISQGAVTVSGYLASKGVRPETVAVELNGTVIAKSDYPTATIKDGDEIEIVRFVGGGAA